MIYPSVAEWAQWNISSSSHRFFVLRWFELLDYQTYSSWQVRTSNVTSILQELRHAGETTVRVPTHHANVKPLLDELNVVLSYDCVTHDHFPVLAQYSTRLKELYDTGVKQGKPQALYEFVRICRIAISELHGYLDSIFGDLESELALEDAHRKKTIETLAMLLAMELKNSGFSREFINSVSEETLLHGREPFSTRFVQFRRRFFAQSETYQCSVLVRGLKPANEHLPDTVDDTIRRFREQDTMAQEIRFAVEARDPFSAAREARRSAEEQFSIQRLFNIQRHLQLQPLVLCERPDGGGAYLIDTTPARLVGPNKPRDLEAKVEGVDQLLGTLTSGDRNLFIAALQFFRLTHSAVSLESRAINLWIALEALFQAMDHDSIIGKLVEFVPRIQALHYPKDTLRALSRDIAPLWKNSSDTKGILTFAAKSIAFRLDPADLGSLLTSDSQVQSFQRLKAITAPNPLLLNRIWRYGEGMFKTPKNLAARIEQHEKNVRWQLRRIYRLRNRITHQGKTGPESAQLLDHLQQYFLSTVHDLIHTLKHRPSLTIAEAFESRRENYRYLLEQLKNTNDRPISGRYVMTGYPGDYRDTKVMFWTDMGASEIASVKFDESENG
jgi:hypothetical protein